MKITNQQPVTLYIACVYMIDTKSKNTEILLYKTSRVYNITNVCKAFHDGDRFVKEVYNKVMSGKITFPSIKNFNKDNVILFEYPDKSTAVIYKYNTSDFENPECYKQYEYLCEYRVEELRFYNYFDSKIIEYCENYSFKHVFVFVRYGAFWHLIGNTDNANEPPTIVKKFWRFTTLDKMIYYLFNRSKNLYIKMRK